MTTIQQILGTPPAIDSSLQGVPQNAPHAVGNAPQPQEKVVGVAPPQVDASLQGKPSPDPKQRAAAVMNPMPEPPATGTTMVKTGRPAPGTGTSTPTNTQKPVTPPAPANTNRGFDFVDKDGNIDTDKMRSWSLDKQMDAIQKWLNQHPEETPEQQKRRQRQEKWRNIYSAIGDGVSALANLYSTTQYAPNAYDPSLSLSERNQARYEKLKAQRENDAEQRLRMYQIIGNAANGMDQAKAAREAAEANAAYKRAQQEREDELAKVQHDVLKARAAKDAAATALNEQTLDYMQKYGWPLKTAKAQAEIALNKANATKAQKQGDAALISANKKGTKSSSSSSKGSGSGSGTGGAYLVYDAQGGKHYFKTYAEAEYYGRKWKTWHSDTKTTTNNKYGIKSTTTTEGKGYSVAPKVTPKPPQKAAAKPQPAHTPAQKAPQKPAPKPQQKRPATPTKSRTVTKKPPTHHGKKSTGGAFD